MYYQTLISEIEEYNKLQNFERVAECITVLLNGMVYTKPEIRSMNQFIWLLKISMDNLINTQTINILQAISWVEKIIRLVPQEKHQFTELQQTLFKKLEESQFILNSDKKSSELGSNKQKQEKIVNEKYKKYFDQMLKVFSDKPLSYAEAFELVQQLKMMILSQNADKKIILEKTILLCQRYSLEKERTELVILQQYWYSPITEITSSLNSEAAILAEQEKLQLEIEANKIIQRYNLTVQDDLSCQLTVHLLELCITEKMTTKLESNSLELMHKITEKFLENQDIGLAYHYLEQAIILAGELDLAEQCNRLTLVQGDLLSGKKDTKEKQGTKFDLNQVTVALKNYFVVYFNLQDSLQLEKNGIKINTIQMEISQVEKKISTLEIRVLYYLSKEWIIQRLMKSSQNLAEFKKTFEEITKIGYQLIASEEFDLARNFYADIQALLTQSTKGWHEILLIQLAEISDIRRGHKSNTYLQRNDWQRYRKQLTEYRQHLSEGNKSFRERQKFYTKSVMRLIAGCAKEVGDLLGPAPDEFCLYGLGSMSRLTLAPCSDFEGGIITSKKESTRWDDSSSKEVKYFLALKELLKFKIQSIGEFRGFRFDKEGNLDVARLCGTPKILLDQNHMASPEVLKDDEMTYSLLSPIFVYGSNRLFQKYQQLLAQALKQIVSQKDPRIWEDVLATAYLPLHCDYFKQHDPFASNNHAMINIKYDYIAALMFAVRDLALHYKMPYTNTADFITELLQQGKISSVFAKAILNSAVLLDEIRVHLHLFYKEQNDGVIAYGTTQVNGLTYNLLCKKGKLQPKQIQGMPPGYYLYRQGEPEKIYALIVHSESWQDKFCLTDVAKRENKSALLKNICWSEESNITATLDEDIEKLISARYASLTDKQQQTVTLTKWALIPSCRLILESLKKGDDSPLFNPLQTMVTQAVLSKDRMALDNAVQSLLYALVLAEADVDQYRIAYLQLLPKMPWSENYLQMIVEVRSIFKKQLLSLNSFLTSQKITAIQQACLDCPLPNGERESQKDKEHDWQKTLVNLVVKEPQQKDKHSIKLSWIDSADKEISGSLHKTVVNYLTTEGFIKKNVLQNTSKNRSKTDGNHLLIPIDLIINSREIKLYLKIFPEIPGIENASVFLADLAVGSGVACVQLARLEIDGEVIPVLLSQTIVGEPLHKVIAAKGDKLNQELNPESFQRNAILSMFTKPEDNKPSNIIYNDGKMISVDNDRNFGRSIIEKGGCLIPQVKNIFYCFPLMRQSTLPIIAAEILYLDPYAVCSLWLDKLFQYRNNLTRLFPSALMKKFLPKTEQTWLQNFPKQINGQASSKETFLQMIFKEGTLRDLFVTWTRLQDLLEKTPNATPFDLLYAADPYLAHYYDKLCKEFPNINICFEKGFSKLYGTEREKSGAYATLPTLLSDTKPGKEISLEDAKIELQQTHDSQKNWKSILDKIKRNLPDGFEEFVKLTDIRLREKIINQIDFATLSNAQQQRLLNTLIQSSIGFRSLKLINCPITDGVLNKILENSPDLLLIQLNNCTNVTGQIIANIARNCPVLKKLILNNLNFDAIDTRTLSARQRFLPIDMPPSVVFSELEFLDISDCQNLTKLYINAPKLKVLKAKNCSQLRSGQLQSSELRKLNLADCSSMATKELSEFVTNFPYLQELVLDGCNKIEKRMHYINFPYLLRINLSVVTEEYIQQLTSLLELFRLTTTNIEQTSLLLTNLHHYFFTIQRGINLLISSLNDLGPNVQTEIALAMRALGRNDKEAINQWQPLLYAKQSSLRAASAIALFNANEDRKQKLTEAISQIFAVEQKIFSNEEDLLKYGIPLLFPFGLAVEAETNILSILYSEKTSIERRKAIINALIYWPAYSKKIINTLQHIILTDRTVESQATALYSYWLLEKKYGNLNNLLAWVKLNLNYFLETMPKLLAYMTNTDPVCAFEIRPNMVKIGIQCITEQQTQFLIDQIIQATDWNDRVKAVQQIGEHQICDTKITELLLKLLQMKLHPNVPVAVIKTLGQLPIKDEMIDIVITQALNDPGDKIEKVPLVIAAAKAASVRGLTKDARIKLLALLKNERSEIREAALLALGSISEFDQNILNAVIECFSDKLIPVQCVAIKIFIKLSSLNKLEVALRNTLSQPSEMAMNSSQKFLEVRRHSDVTRTKSLLNNIARRPSVEAAPPIRPIVIPTQMLRGTGRNQMPFLDSRIRGNDGVQVNGIRGDVGVQGNGSRGNNVTQGNSIRGNVGVQVQRGGLFPPAGRGRATSIPTQALRGMGRNQMPFLDSRPTGLASQRIHGNDVTQGNGIRGDVGVQGNSIRGNDGVQVNGIRGNEVTQGRSNGVQVQRGGQFPPGRGRANVGSQARFMPPPPQGHGRGQFLQNPPMPVKRQLPVTQEEEQSIPVPDNFQVLKVN